MSCDVMHPSTAQQTMYGKTTRDAYAGAKFAGPRVYRHVGEFPEQFRLANRLLCDRLLHVGSRSHTQDKPLYISDVLH